MKRYGVNLVDIQMSQDKKTKVTVHGFNGSEVQGSSKFEPSYEQEINERKVPLNGEPLNGCVVGNSAIRFMRIPCFPSPCLHGFGLFY